MRLKTKACQGVNPEGELRKTMELVSVLHKFDPQKPNLENAKIQ